MKSMTSWASQLTTSLRTHPALWAALFLLVLTAFRFAYCTHLDLLPDEAYYRLWSKHLDAAYYSKGPGVAWTIAFGRWVAGDTVFGVRWLSAILAAGTVWQLFLLARRLFDERTALWCVGLAAIVPLMAIGSLIMTIDPLSVFFWTTAAWLFWQAHERERGTKAFRARDWILVGLAVGLGFLAKFVNVLQLASFLLFWLLLPRTAPEHAFWKSRRFGLIVTFFALCTLPILWWNAHHGWVTATHLQERGALDRAWQLRPGAFLEFVGMQAVAYGPAIFVGVLIAVIVAGREYLHARRRSASVIKIPLFNEASLYALALFLPTFLFYSVLALNDQGEANWTATAYVGGLLLMVRFWKSVAQRGVAWRRVVVAGLLLTLAQTIVLHETSWLHLPPKLDPFTRVRTGRPLAEWVERHRAADPTAPVLANRYQWASVLAFYLPDRPITYVPPARAVKNQFAFWPKYRVAPNGAAFFVTDQPDEPPPDSVFAEFEKVEHLDTWTNSYRGYEIKRFALYRLSGPRFEQR